MSHTDDVSKLKSFSSLSDEHLLNIDAMLVTLVVSKVEIFRARSDEQSQNILDILSTFAVLKFDKSKI